MFLNLKYIWTWIIHGILGYLWRERPKDLMKNVSLQISNQKKCLSDWWKPLFCSPNLEHPIPANLPFIQFREIFLGFCWRYDDAKEQGKRLGETWGNTFGDMTRPNDPRWSQPVEIFDVTADHLPTPTQHESHGPWTVCPAWPFITKSWRSPRSNVNVTLPKLFPPWNLQHGILKNLSKE